MVDFCYWGYMPKIAEISRLVQSYRGQNWHTPALSNIIGVINPWYRDQWLGWLYSEIDGVVIGLTQNRN